MSKEHLKSFNTWNTPLSENRSTILVVNWLLWIRLVSPKSLGQQVKGYLFWEGLNYEFTSVINSFCFPYKFPFVKIFSRDEITLK